MQRSLAGALATTILVGAGSAHTVSAFDERVYETANFSITWMHDPTHPDAPDLTDDDSDGVPDAIENLGEAFEFARDFEIGTLGYAPPPVEGKYPVYIAKASEIGVTRKAPGGTGKSRASFITVSAPFVSRSTSESETKALAVHEFFHAIQMGYDAEEDHWIGEATATWIEDVALDEKDPNHLWLPYFVPEPRKSLLAPGGLYEYGAFLFFQFLTERYGYVGIVREMWEAMAAPESVPGSADLDSGHAIEAVLAARGIGLTEAWADFLLWRLRLRRFEEGAAYVSEVANVDWPRLLHSTTVHSESCRLTSDDDLENPLPPLSGDYVAFKPHRSLRAGARARLTVRGPVSAAGFYLVKRSGAPTTEHHLIFDQEGVARAEVNFGQREVRRVTVGLGNAGLGVGDATLEYSLRLVGRRRVAVSEPTGADATSYGTGIVLTGMVSCRKQPAPFAQVAITEKQVVSGAERSLSAQTDKFGRWRLGVTPEVRSLYSVDVSDPLLSSARSSGHEVGVRVAVTIEVAQDRIPAGSAVAVSGSVFPAHPGATVLVEYRRPGASDWEIGAEASVGEAGGYSLQFFFPADGIWEIRTRVPDTGDTDHDPGASGVRIIEVFR